MDSFRGAKPAQDKTAKTFFLLDLRACLSIPQNEAPQVPSRTQRNQLTLLGKETRPICKTNTTTTKCNLSAASVLRFKGVHVNSRVRIVHLICVDGCYIYIYMCVFLAATQFLNFQKHCWCVCLFFCYLIAKTVS